MFDATRTPPTVSKHRASQLRRPHLLARLMMPSLPSRRCRVERRSRRRASRLRRLQARTRAATPPPSRAATTPRVPVRRPPVRPAPRRRRPRLYYPIDGLAAHPHAFEFLEVLELARRVGGRRASPSSVHAGHRNVLGSVRVIAFHRDVNTSGSSPAAAADARAEVVRGSPPRAPRAGGARRYFGTVSSVPAPRAEASAASGALRRRERRRDGRVGRRLRARARGPRRRARWIIRRSAFRSATRATVRAALASHDTTPSPPTPSFRAASSSSLTRVVAHPRCLWCTLVRALHRGRIGVAVGGRIRGRVRPTRSPRRTRAGTRSDRA